jgi:uncharacterized DUF497 family protein
MRLHSNFEWDSNKADENLEKHNVSFGDASYVLADEEGDVYHIEEFDDLHSDSEDRYITTASHPSDRSIILRICWTDASTKRSKITRIISARLAKPIERTQYVKEIGNS